MYTYKSLENTSIEVLHKTFVQAFSDYQVKIDLPRWKFEQMLERRGYTPELSMGAFDNENLVGFILNGFRLWNGKPTVYDTGTGVLKEYRQQGITSTIFQNVVVLLKQKCVEQYLLEVIKENTAAYKLYSKQEFKVTRAFECFSSEKDSCKARMTHKVEHIDKIGEDIWKKFISFWDFAPSWQNSIDSIKAVPDTFSYAVVKIDNDIVGYGIIDKRTGDIPQLAVDKAYRRKGIGSSIISDLLNNTSAKKAAFLNVDESCIDMCEFLLINGFDIGVGQYEMMLNLS